MRRDLNIHQSQCMVDRGAGATMPVTGKSFRRRRADSESEEDEQDSEEVRCVWDGAFKGQEERAARGTPPPRGASL